ncbi:MAG: acyl-CoA desaturase [Phycisphaeraceae bacterium]
MTESHAQATPPRRGGLQWSNLDWKVIIAMTVLHVVALAAVLPMFFTWSGLALMFLFMWISGGLGITLGFHRLLTHRSFRTPRWLEYTLTLCGCLAWQGAPANWVGVHRLHHKHADSDHDPHSPDHGFTWSHILWTLHKRIEGIRGVDAARDLMRDRPMRWINRLYWLPQFILAGALLGIGWAIGGWTLALSWIIWGIALRTVIVFHGTWFVNSAAHTWGYQNYESTGEHSTNNWWVAIVSFGEGWHNNHHAHPRSAAHGLRWFEFDPTWWTIKLLSWVGLARDVHLPKPEQLPKSAPASTETAAKPTLSSARRTNPANS